MPPPKPEGGVDKKLAETLKRAKKLPADRPYFFALVIKGAAAGKLLVNKKKIPPKEIAEAKKETGGSAVVKGVCYGGSDGEIVFETVKMPAPAWTVLTKKLAKEDAGLMIKPLFKFGRDDEQIGEAPEGPEEDEADDIPEAEADPTVAAAKAAEAAWRARVDDVTARVKEAAGKGNPAARDMALGISQAGALFRGGDSAGAQARLAQVEKLLGPAKSGGEKAELTARLNGLAAGIKAAMAGPDAARVGALFTAVSGQLKNEDFPRAGKNLDELEQVLAAGSGAATAGADALAEYKAKLTEYTPAIKTALAAKGPNAAEITKLFTQANALSKPGGNPAEALARLAECYKLAGGTVPNAPPQSTAGPEAKTDVTKRMNALKAKIKDALAGPNAARVGALLTAANGQMKNGDFVQAGKNLDEMEQVLAATAGGKDDPAAKAAAEYKAKLAEWTPAIKTALAAKGPNAVEIGKLLTQATALAKPGGNPVEALAKLAECHKLATAGAGFDAPKPTAGEPKTTEPEDDDAPAAISPVLFSKARIEYIRVRDTAVAELARLRDAMLKNPGIQEDARAASIVKAINDLPKELAALDDKLVDALDDALTAPTEGKKAAAAMARGVIDGYLKDLAGSPILTHADEQSGFGKFKIYGPLTASLKQIAARLAV